MKERRHAVAQIAAQRTRDGRQIRGLRIGQNFQRTHDRAKPFHEVHAVEGGKTRKAFVFRAAFELSFAANEVQGHVAGKHAVATPSPVHFRAFQKNAVPVPGHVQEKTDGRVHVRREPADALTHSNGRCLGCHVDNPQCELIKKCRSPERERHLLLPNLHHYSDVKTASSP